VMVSGLNHRRLSSVLQLLIHKHHPFSLKSTVRHSCPHLRRRVPRRATLRSLNRYNKYRTRTQVYLLRCHQVRARYSSLLALSCRTLLEARGHLLLSRMPQCNRRHNERPASLVQFQTWSPPSKELNRKPCIACRTWTRYTSCLRAVTRVHPNLRIRISPSTTCQGIPTPRRRTILRRRCQFSVRRAYSRNWTSRHCFTSFITTLGRINSISQPRN